MSSSPATAPAGGFQSTLQAFADLRRLPLAFWLIVLTFAVESMAYFAMLPLMVTFLTADLHWSDAWATPAVSLFSGAVTLFMLGAGSIAESFGVRRAIVAALLLTVAGRVVYCVAPSAGGAVVVVVIAGLLITALGDAILQPVCYSGIKQYTDQRTSAMGYALIYAIMNAGIIVVGEISSRIRPAVDAAIKARATGGDAPGGLIGLLAARTGSGVQAVNWVGTVINVLALLMFVVLMVVAFARPALRPDKLLDGAPPDARPLGQRLKEYFTEGPFGNARFLFFIFMLLPVRTVFVHAQILTLPAFVLRVYPSDVANHMEQILNWTNSLIILIGVPVLTAVFRKTNIYTVMIVGSLITAAPVYLLAAGANFWILITFQVLYSIGEAMWTARFLEYASELAPPGRIAQYMGLANIPWLLAKLTTGLYAGLMLERFCPLGRDNTGVTAAPMWTLYGSIAMLSPIGLLLARKWVLVGLHKPSASGQ
ncbi:Major Facilitator Superfamily protein [Phycisphaerae bacterium RAS1]|nr:Major Facilitator Superfamily protein [Phycisphaerae bacterium RAS1]